MTHEHDVDDMDYEILIVNPAVEPYYRINTIPVMACREHMSEKKADPKWEEKFRKAEGRIPYRLAHPDATEFSFEFLEFPVVLDLARRKGWDMPGADYSLAYAIDHEGSDKKGVSHEKGVPYTWRGGVWVGETEAFYLAYLLEGFVACVADDHKVWRPMGGKKKVQGFIEFCKRGGFSIW